MQKDTTITARYTEKPFPSSEEQQKPFFLIFPHRRSSAFGAGKKIHGNKREWSLWGLDSGNRLVDGRALQALKQEGIDENTLVLFLLQRFGP